MGDTTKILPDVVTETIKQTESTSDSMSEIIAMREDSDPRIQEASENAIDAKLINSETNLKKAKISHAIWTTLSIPLSAFGYAGKKINEILNNYSEEQKNSLQNKINRLADGHIEITPQTLPTLASATEALLYSEQEPNLREMFEDLIVNTIDKMHSTHPSFVEILKQLSGKEAKFLKVILSSNENQALVNVILSENNGHIILYRNLIGLVYINSKEFIIDHEIPVFIDNWVRLGLISTTTETSFTDKENYEAFNKHPIFVDLRNKHDNPEKNEHVEMQEGILRITDFGKAFARSINII